MFQGEGMYDLGVRRSEGFRDGWLSIYALELQRGWAEPRKAHRAVERAVRPA